MINSLVMLRHGQDIWNLDDLFTGWTDIDLLPAGVEEGRRAGRLMGEAGVEFDLCYTSVLATPR